MNTALNTNDVGKTLREVLPSEFKDFPESRANKFLDRKVICSCPGAWPGREKNVHWWVILEGDDGIAVGWNENPSRGWSFPVTVIPSHQ
jgi:hypothetical protein